jgi:hypothetical protein
MMHSSTFPSARHVPFHDITFISGSDFSVVVMTTTGTACTCVNVVKGMAA